VWACGLDSVQVTLLAVGKEKVDKLLTAFWVVEVDVQAPVNQPAALLESMQRIRLFLGFMKRCNFFQNKLLDFSYWILLRSCRSIP